MHKAQQMPLPLTVSCSSKSRLVLTFLVLPFWYLLTRVDPDILQTSSKTVVCVCVLEILNVNVSINVTKSSILMIPCVVYYVALPFNHTFKIVG